MSIVKSIIFGFFSIIAGNLVGFILWGIFLIPVDIVVEKILSAEEFLSSTARKKFSYVSRYAFVGLTVGTIHSSLIFFLELYGWILWFIFIVYIILFMGSKHRNSFTFYVICDSDSRQFKNLLRITEIITFIMYMSGLYGLWYIFMKSG